MEHGGFEDEDEDAILVTPNSVSSSPPPPPSYPPPPPLPPAPLRLKANHHRFRRHPWLLYVGGYLGMMLLSLTAIFGLLATGYFDGGIPDMALVIRWGIVGGLASWLFFLLFVYDMWETLRGCGGTRSPSAMVALSFVPIYGIYLNTVGLAKEANEVFRMNDRQDLECSPRQASMVFIAAMLSALIPFIAIALPILLVSMMIRFSDAANRLGATHELGPARPLYRFGLVAIVALVIAQILEPLLFTLLQEPLGDTWWQGALLLGSIALVTVLGLFFASARWSGSMILRCLAMVPILALPLFAMSQLSQFLAESEKMEFIHQGPWLGIVMPLVWFLVSVLIALGYRFLLNWSFLATLSTLLIIQLLMPTIFQVGMALADAFDVELFNYTEVGGGTSHGSLKPVFLIVVRSIFVVGTLLMTLIPLYHTGRMARWLSWSNADSERDPLAY